MRALADSFALRCRLELADSRTGGDGDTLTLRLSDADSLHSLQTALAGSIGGRYVLHLHKIDEERPALDGARRRHLEEALQARPLSESISRLVREPAFWSFLEEMDFAAVDGEVNPRHARNYVYRVCGVECARELDDPLTAERYEALVVTPFRSWLDAR